MSDRELVDYQEKSRGKKHCGKISPYQLERKIVVTISTPNYTL
jgi:hypothetical protein